MVISATTIVRRLTVRSAALLAVAALGGSMAAIVSAQPAHAWSSNTIACSDYGNASVSSSTGGGNSGTMSYAQTSSSSWGCEDLLVGWRWSDGSNGTESGWHSSEALISWQNAPSGIVGGYHRERHGFTART